MNEIQIEVETRFVERESAPERDRYVFAYTITIRNGGALPARLMNRHWVITDGQGRTEEVSGPGVVGRQPRLEPGESHRYTSAAILATPVGSMHGHYEFERDDGGTFLAPIPAFSLRVARLVH